VIYSLDVVTIAIKLQLVAEILTVKDVANVRKIKAVTVLTYFVDAIFVTVLVMKVDLTIVHIFYLLF